MKIIITQNPKAQGLSYSKSSINGSIITNTILLGWSNQDNLESKQGHYVFLNKYAETTEINQCHPAVK